MNEELYEELVKMNKASYLKGQLDLLEIFLETINKLQIDFVPKNSVIKQIEHTKREMSKL